LAEGVPDVLDEDAEGETACRDASWLGWVGDSEPDQTIIPTR
jgi:hypothetical protein